MIQLRVLGGIDLDGPPGTDPKAILLQPKRLGLLVWLVLAPGGTWRRRDTAAALFWPESDTEHARSSLRQALTFIRRCLGDGVIVTRGDEEIAVDLRVVQCDVVAFRAAAGAKDLVSAAALYAGELLPGFYVPQAAPELDDWLGEERADATRCAADVLRALSEQRSAVGDWTGAARHARMAAALGPHDEMALSRLVTCLAAAGDRAGALHAYEDFERRLADDFGVTPSPQTLSLVRAVRTSAALASVTPSADTAAQTILAEQLSQPVARLAAFRDPSVAGELGAPHVRSVMTPVPARRTARRYGALGLAALVLTAVAGAIALPWRAPSVPLDENLVAVAPFEVLSPSLALWQEGMGDVLSRYLDGAGPLRTVSQSVVLRRWAGRADRASAEALARRTGAGIVVIGTAVPHGLDSVLLRAAILRIAEGGAQEEVEVRGGVERMGALADSLGSGILEALGRSRPIGAIRFASIGGASLPALKAFLRGEQLYRQGQWDSALVQYDRALSLDSTLALANRRMAAILWFDPPTKDAYKGSEEYARRAEQLNRGLGTQDSLLISGLAAMARLSEGSNDGTFFADFRKTGAAFQAAANHYPGDPEAWYFLGEYRYHWAKALGMPPEDQLEAYDRAIALDSSFATVYEHTVQLALHLDQPDRARRYANARLALGSEDARSVQFRLDSMLLSHGHAGASDMDRVLDTMTAWGPLWNAMFDFAQWPDSAETAVRIARIFPSPRRDYAGAPGFVRDSVVQKRVLSSMLARRGHLREAYQAAPDSSANGWQNQFLALALFGVVPAAVADAEFRRLIGSDSLWPRRRSGLPWWLARGDTVSLVLFAKRADSIGRAHADPLGKAEFAYARDAAHAYLALLRSDSAAALRGLEALPDSLCLLGSCFYQNLTRARLLAASGRDPEAARVLDRWLTTGTGPWFVVGILERGRIAERLNDREKAADSYNYVLSAWREADAELEPYLTEAHAGLVRLTGEKRR